MQRKPFVLQLVGVITNWSFCPLLGDAHQGTADARLLKMALINPKKQLRSECQTISLEHCHKSLKKLPDLVLQRALQILFHFGKASKVKKGHKIMDQVEQHYVLPIQFGSRPPLENKFLRDETQYQ